MAVQNVEDMETIVKEPKKNGVIDSTHANGNDPYKHFVSIEQKKIYVESFSGTIKDAGVSCTRKTAWSARSWHRSPPCRACSRARRSSSRSATTNCWITAAVLSAPLPAVLSAPLPSPPPPRPLPPPPLLLPTTRPDLPGGTTKLSTPCLWRSCSGSTRRPI